MKRGVISSVLRFQILRRDGYSCRYCGAKAAEFHLVVDHVVPVVLGGETVPENLVSSCQPCNSGKAAMPADAANVAQVQADALRWSLAMRLAAETQLRDSRARRAYVSEFLGAWSDLEKSIGETLRMDDDWETTIVRFWSLGLEMEMLLLGIDTAFQRMPPWKVWKYFCGFCWRTLEERSRMAEEIVRKEP